MAKRGPKGQSKPMSDTEFDQLLGLIRIDCTRDEICAVLDMSDTTLNRRLKERGETNFEALYKKNIAHGNASLRRMQWKSADAGGWQAQRWLGIQRLNQSDRTEQNVTANVDLNAAISPAETLKDYLDAIAKRRGATD